MGAARSIFAALLGGLGQGVEKYGDYAVQQQSLQSSLEKQRESRLTEAQDPRMIAAGEAEYKRKIMLQYGIDPDTGKPIPGIYEAIQKFYANKRAPKSSGTGNPFAD